MGRYHAGYVPTDIRLGVLEVKEVDWWLYNKANLKKTQEQLCTKRLPRYVFDDYDLRLDI